MNAYRYTNYDNGGIVVAQNKDEAIRYLNERYDTSEFEVWNAEDDDFYDVEHPNVYECY